LLSWEFTGTCGCRAGGIVLARPLNFVDATLLAAQHKQHNPVIRWMLIPFGRAALAAIEKQAGPAVAAWIGGTSDEFPQIPVSAGQVMPPGAAVGSQAAVTVTGAPSGSPHGVSVQMVKPTIAAETLAQAAVGTEATPLREVYAAASSPWFLLSRPYHRVVRVLRRFRLLAPL